MLKWFRAYNKFLLVILGSLLMVSFLVIDTVSSLQPSHEDQVIGRINGEKIYVRDRIQAAREQEIIARGWPALAMLTHQKDPMQWLLMVHGAKQAGLGASNEQIAQLLGSSGLKGNTLADIARQMQTNADDLTSALRHWLMIQQYMELQWGLGHLSLDQRMATLQQASLYSQMGLTNVEMLIDPARGTQRISRPLLERFLQDQEARVTVQAVAIRAERELPDVPAADDKAVVELYNEYKDELPGSTRGYGLGYKLPDRVKLEYLTIPLANARKAVTVEESQLLAYYDENQAEFLPPAPADTTQPAAGAPRLPRPYLEVRETIRSRLLDDAARKLVIRIASAAQASLQDSTRKLADQGGYKVISSDWTPLSLSDLSKQLEERFGVQLEVRRIQDRWLTLNEIQTLPGLGMSGIELGQQRLPTAYYISGAKELNPDERHPALSLHLQVYMASQPVTSLDGSLHIFRLTDAQASHTPRLEDIRGQVAQDVQRIEAYKRLLAQIDTWKARLDQPLDKLASELGVSVIGPASFNRRDSFGGTSVVPQIPGIGQSEDFVDKVFALALQAPEDQPQVTDVIAADDRLSLYVVRVVDFEPMTRRDFDQQMSLPFARVWLKAAMLEGLTEKDSPFTVDNLVKRVGFTWTNPPSEDETRSN